MEQPLVSVIIPTYNYGRFIGETLESLRAQTHAEWECIVVDDGSTDDTAEVVARWVERDARIRYLRQPNQRQAVAKNTGLAEARGRYVQFLDADDLLEPRKLERQVEFLDAHPEADLVYGGTRYFRTECPSELLYGILGNTEPWMPQLSGAGREVVFTLVRTNIMAINAALVRRETIEEVGGFDPALTPVEDWDYWLRCALYGKRFEYRGFEGTLALVRSHPASSTRQRGHLDAWRRLRRKIDALLVDQAELRRLNREQFAQFEAGFGISEVEEGRRLSAARSFLKAMAVSVRLNSRGKWLLCALASPFAGAEQLRKLMAFSPSRERTKR